MGPENVEDKHSGLLSRACRLPRKVADRVSDLSNRIYREHLRPLRLESNIPYKFLVLAVLLLMYLPSFLGLSFRISPQAEWTLGDEVERTTYCEINEIPEVGVTHAVLLNNSPFTPSNDWKIEAPFVSLPYDFYRYAKTDSDGYHLQGQSNDISPIRFSRNMPISIFNCSDVSILVELEGVTGSTRIFLTAIASETSEEVESIIPANQIVQVNVSAPLVEAKQSASSWLDSILFLFWIDLSEGDYVIVRSVTIEAVFTMKLSRVQFDIQSTENESLYENPCMKKITSPPHIMIVQNNDSSSAAVYSPVQADDEIFLPPGIYEGMAYWYTGNQGSPDPSNTTSWAPNIDFTVLEDTALDVDVKLFALRLDIDLSPSVILASYSIYLMDGYLYNHGQAIVGSTLYSPLFDYFYIPGGVGELRIRISTLSTSWFIVGSYQDRNHFDILADTFLSTSNSSRNIMLRVFLPYVTAGNAVFGLGEFAVFAIEGALLIGFTISVHRKLRHSDFRNRLSDSRLLPIILLGMSVFLPWSLQTQSSPGSTYDGVYWISWFSVPFKLQWSDGTAIQLLCATRDWWNASLVSTFFLFVPLFYACLSLSTPETEDSERFPFAFALFLPYLVVLSGFYFSVLSADTISVGPLLAIAALPAWLVRIALRRLGITK